MSSPAATLSPTELAGYRRALEARLDALLGEIAADRDKLGELEEDAQHVLDRKDQADRAMLASVDDAELARDLNEMREVRVALERIDAGHYGECQGCGEAIGRERLAVQPAATRCLACQAASERAAASHPGPSSPSA
jgi:DnaK suppressor protein